MIRRLRRKEVLVVAVEENTSAMKVTAEELLSWTDTRTSTTTGNNNSNSNSDGNGDVKNNTREGEEGEEQEEEGKKDSSLRHFKNVVYVRSYAECAGVLAAHKAGILLDSITAHVPSIPVTRLSNRKS
jgi:hypothetical protein